MKVTIDTTTALVTLEKDGQITQHPFASAEAFEAATAAWQRVGWDVKHIYSFAWFGRPFIQLPDDVLRLQEVVYSVRPTVVLECGIAHGGGQVFYASLLKAMGGGRVIGVDVEIRPHNRKALEEHELYPYMTLIEASSIAPETVKQVHSLIRPDDRVLVALDSNHSKAHVLAELEAYAPLVSPGSYIIAMDGYMRDLVGAPRAKDDWSWNNPSEAAVEFAAAHPEFELVEPTWPFNEGLTRSRVTYWPNAFLRRRA